MTVGDALSVPQTPKATQTGYKVLPLLNYNTFFLFFLDVFLFFIIYLDTGAERRGGVQGPPPASINKEGALSHVLKFSQYLNKHLSI